MTYATKYDLRFLASPVLNQGTLGTCAENAMSSAISIIEKQIGSNYGAISRLQSYYDYRDLVHQSGVDSGTSPYFMLDNAKTIGLAKETSWVYDISKYTVKPTPNVYTEAAQHTITGFTDISQSAQESGKAAIVDMIKDMLSQGKALILGFTLKTWFDNEVNVHDINLMNPANSVADEGRGGHAVVILGANDSLCNGAGGYIVQNSWGDSAGDHGYFVIPYSEFPDSGDNWWNTSTNNYNLMTLQVINGFDGKDQTWTHARIDAEQIYVSNLDRGAEISGLDYWADALKSGVVTKSQMADMILNSSEYLSFHAGFTNAQKIDEYYLDTLGRPADAGGLAFWSNAVDTNAATLGTVFSQISDQVYWSQTGIDHDFYSNKINVAMTYSVTYQKSTHQDIIKAVLTHVTSDINYTEILKVGMAHDLGII